MIWGRKQKRILVLGGGSARGFCNIGVLKVIEQEFGGREGFPFDMVVGTSMGSLVGAAYCLGMEVSELEKEAFDFQWQKLVDPGFRSTGLLKGDKLEKIINEMFRGRGFSDLEIPFAITTTDIQTGQELIHVSGDIVKLVRASCSWPGIFAAVDIDGRLLTDGGVRNSVPTKAAKQLGGTFIMAVNPGFSVKTQKIDNVLKALIQSIQIMGEELNMYQSSAADIVVKPELKGLDQLDFDAAERIVAEGQEAARKKMRLLRKKLELSRIWSFSRKSL